MYLKAGDWKLVGEYCTEDNDDYWDSFIIGGDLNGHVVRDANGYGSGHAEGVRILELSDAVGIVMCNIFFRKEDSMLNTIDIELIM